MGAAAKFLCPPIFLVTLPGVLFTLIFLYMILFSKQNILNAQLLVLFIPIWFGITLIFYAKIVDFEQIPGFDKIDEILDKMIQYWGKQRDFVNFFNAV